MSLELLEAQICSLAGRLAAATYQWLRLIAEFDERKGWTGWGIKSCAHWLAWSCSVSPQAAREYLRVARTLVRLPLISAAFAAGTLSYSKVKAITRVADLLPEHTLLDQALTHTAAQLDRVVRAFRRTDSAGPERASRAAARWFYDDDGTFVLHARLPAADGAVVLAALQMAEHTLQPEPTTQPDATQPEYGPAVSAADTLVAMADLALAAGQVDNSGDDRHLVILHLDANATAHPAPDAANPSATGTETGSDPNTTNPDGVGGWGAGSGRCHLHDGPGLPRPAVERLLCDAAVVAVAAASLGHDGTGEPLRLGRKTRKISPALRRALRVRDGGCQHPGCNRRRFLEAHHVQHWKDGGPTDLDNLILLCRFHHGYLHDHHLTLAPATHSGHPTDPARLGGSGWTFRRPDGTVIPAVRPLTPHAVDQTADPADETAAHTVDRLFDDSAPAADHAQGEGFRLAESVGAWCRAADGPADPPTGHTPPAEPFINPLAWLAYPVPHEHTYADETDPPPHQSDTEPSAADLEFSAAVEQLDTYDELIAFCRASVYGTEVSR